MYGTYRRMKSLIDAKAANPESVVIVLRHEFAKAMLENEEASELVPLMTVMNARHLEMKSHFEEGKKMAEDAENLELENYDGRGRTVMTSIARFTFGRLAKKVTAQKDMFSVKVPVETLESFLNDLSAPEVAPMVKKVYAGETRVL